MRVAAKMMDIARAIFDLAMLAAMARLSTRFILGYLAPGVWYLTVYALQQFTNACARKRVNNKSIHHRKFAPFPG